MLPSFYRLRKALKNRRILYAFAVFSILFGIWFRTAGITEPTVSDDSTYLYKAKLLYDGKRPYRDVFMAHPPIYHIITSFLYEIFGVSVLVGHLSPVFFSSASVILVFISVRRFYGLESAVLSTFVFSMSYGVILTTKVAMLNSEALFFSLAASYAFMSGLMDSSKKRLFLSGLLCGLGFLSKFPAIVVFASIIVYCVFRRLRLETLLLPVSGFLLTILFFLGFFYCDELVSQLFLYHANKISYPLKSRIVLSLPVIFGNMPLMVFSAVLGVVNILSLKQKSEVDAFYLINLGLGLLFAVGVKYSHPIAPLMYFAISSYTLAVLSGRMVENLTVPSLVLFAYLFLSTSFLNDLRFHSCYGIGRSRLQSEIDEAVGYIRLNPGSLIVDDYTLFYVPLRGGYDIVDGTVDLNPYRFTHDLDFEDLRVMRDKARYIIVYEHRMEDFKLERKLAEELGIEKNDVLSNITKTKRDILLEDSLLEYRAGGILIYGRA